MSADFSEALTAIADVEGWLSADQARRLFERAALVPAGGVIVEIGSCRGRSTIVLGLGSSDDVQVIAIDPHTGDDRGPRQWHTSRAQGEADHLALRANLLRAGLSEKVRPVRTRSSDALHELSGPVELLYVDGAHRYRPARGDIVDWGRRVAPGGWMLVHDAFSSVGVTLAILRELALGRGFVYRGRCRSLALYQRAATPLGVHARALNALRQTAQLPWFARNLVVKLALAAGLEPVAEALGHRASDGLPY